MNEAEITRTLVAFFPANCMNGTDAEKRDLSARFNGHALALSPSLIRWERVSEERVRVEHGRYFKRAHHGHLRRVDRVNFQKVNAKEQGHHAVVGALVASPRLRLR